MEKFVWKFVLHIEGITTVEMPKDSELLCFREQLGRPCLWALVNPKAEIETRTFRVVGTGHCITQEVKQYIGTALLLNGARVIHLFEV